MLNHSSAWDCLLDGIDLLLAKNIKKKCEKKGPYACFKRFGRLGGRFPLMMMYCLSKG